MSVIPSWLVLAGTEARLILRNRTVAVSATVMPLALGGLLVYRGFPGASAVGVVVGLMLIMLLAFSVYLTTTMTLASRRGTLYLKRLRTTSSSTSAIIAGLSFVPVLLCAAQATVLCVLLAVAEGSTPQRPLWLAVAVLLGGAMCAALAFLTASFTKTPEAAQITTTPALVLLFGGAVWAMNSPVTEVGWGQLAVPGGAVLQLARIAWGGPGLTLPGDAMGLFELLGAPIVLSLAHVAIASLIAARLFTWQPRN